jgi:UbiD family decarboxylase
LSDGREGDPAPVVPLAAFLSRDPDVRRVDGPVALRLGITEEVLRDPRRPVWFTGTGPTTVVGNLWSSRERVARHLGVGTADLPDLLLTALEHPIPPLRVEGPAAFHEVPGPVDLTRLPVPVFFPRDAGPYLTAAIFSARWKGKQNLSFHRLWVQNPKGGPVRLVPRHLDRMVRLSRQEGQDLPVAIVLGAPLEFTLAAAVATDYAVDEMEIASALWQRRTGRPLPVVELPSGCQVPRDCEIVLEGRVTQRDAPEGPFLDVLGTYDPIREQPVVEIDRVYTTERPVLPVVVAGTGEHYVLMGLPREPIILRAVRAAVPGVRAVRLTEGGAAWLHAVVSIEKRREGDGRNAALAALAGHASLKRVVVVDPDIDIFDDEEVEWALATRFQADRGLLVVPGATGSSLDPSAGRDNVTAKWALDATLPLGVDRAPFTREPYLRRGKGPNG